MIFVSAPQHVAAHFISQKQKGQSQSQCQKKKKKKKKKKSQIVQFLISDSEASAVGFQCYDGSWLPEYAFCDGQRDCSGKNWEDEPQLCRKFILVQFETRLGLNGLALQ